MYLCNDAWYDLAFFCCSKYCGNAFDSLNLRLLQLGIAAGYKYQRIRILSVQLSDDVAALLVGVFCDGACVHKEDISSLCPRHSLESFLLQCSFVCRSLGVIQFTSEGYECYSFHNDLLYVAV